MYKTEQEKFWAENFGNEYIQRNQGDKLLAANLNFFSKALAMAGNLKSCIEFGANIGMNLKALKLLYPTIISRGIEINTKAALELEKVIGATNVINSSIFDFDVTQKSDISLIKGVLIHINPDMLDLVYQKLYDSSNSYILIAEYYNPTPVTISYRGHEDKLFKRDFAGEFLNKFNDTILVDYGFSYRNDNAFPQDDITWFLIKKK
jgi:spore coat polysaccharide biosynthesis protein SpsF